MESHKLAFKFFVENPSGIAVEEFVPVFHRWIQTRALDGHQLIDVADYKHVQDGPGALLVSHEANIHLDLGDNRLGLLYIRKQPLAGSFSQRLREVLGYTLRCASMLENDSSLKGRIQFRPNEALFRIYDRLHAPNTPETFANIGPALESVLKNVYGTGVELSHTPNAERLFEVMIKAPRFPSIENLLTRMTAA
jgi:hypothetical protein